MATDVATKVEGPRRPALRYHGGKWRLAPWIISHFPPHRTYVEPYGGAASVLLRKPRAYAEVYNDLDREIVEMFRAWRENPEELAVACALTPFARDEYQQAFERTEDPIESARRVLIRSWMGFGSNAVTRAVRSGFRSNVTRSGTTPTHDWENFPSNVLAVAERLMGVTIENRPALNLMAIHERPDTLFYLDPPYVRSTRSKRMGAGSHAGYTHEMTDEQHWELGRRAGVHSHDCALRVWL